MTTTRTIHLSASDHEQLSLRLQLAQPRSASGPMAQLRTELERAVLVPDEELPPSVARIGSTVRVQDMDTDETDVYTLTLPERADPAQQRISVLAPLGLALLGYAEGDELTWAMPRGTRRLRILQVS